MLNGALSVVGKVSSTVTTTAKHPIDGELSLFSMSNSNILESISATQTHAHAHADNSLDVESLFFTVQNIIKRSAQIVDSTVQGIQVHVETIEEKPSKSSFSSQLCTLKSIGYELSCKPPGEEIAFKSTISILNKLSNYSWDVKAVLTLAAFAFEYGEFWHLAQLQQSDQLAKSLAALKGVTVLFNPANLQKHRQAIVELNGLIKATLQVIEIIFELENLSSRHHKDVQGLAIAMQEIHVDVFWVIMSIVACATKITILTSDEDKPHDLTLYAEKIHYIINKLKNQRNNCKKQIEELQNYWKLCKLIGSCNAILPILKALIFAKDDLQPIIDGSTNKTVSIDVLERKNVLLFISRLNISEEDINILKPIHEEIKNHNDLYSILWIPIVEQWTEELKKKFEILRVKMPWYVVQYFSPIAGIRYIKEEWGFKGKPIVVVLNLHGRVENQNAFDGIRILGIKAFPFTTSHIGSIIVHPNWIEPIVSNIDPIIPIWFKEEKYIFFYGGEDNDWIQQFTKSAGTLVNDPILKEAKINIELFSVGKGSKGGEDLGIIGRFWNGIEGLFFTKIHHNQHVDTVSKEVQKLISYKNEKGWALLSKGSKVEVTGHGLTMLRVVGEFEKWKNQIKEKGFEVAFKEYYNNVLSVILHCSRLDIPSEAGKVLETMQCPECPRVMETFTSYKCCHIDGPLKAHH